MLFVYIRSLIVKRCICRVVSCYIVPCRIVLYCIVLYCMTNVPLFYWSFVKITEFKIREIPLYFELHTSMTWSTILVRSVC